MDTGISTIIVNETNLRKLLPALEAYGIYMYEKLGLTDGKEKFYKELYHFPMKKYSSPEGCFLLALYENEVAGCTGLSKYDEDRCELKRMYSFPLYRNKGIAHTMLKESIVIAKKLGYKYILLDTNKEMDAAIKFYRKMGFEEIDAYCENENPNPVYFRYDLLNG